jgi:hypothetical protein
MHTKPVQELGLLLKKIQRVRLRIRTVESSLEAALHPRIGARLGRQGASVRATQLDAATIIAPAAVNTFGCVMDNPTPCEGVTPRNNVVSHVEERIWIRAFGKSSVFKHHCRLGQASRSHPLQIRPLVDTRHLRPIRPKIQSRARPTLCSTRSSWRRPMVALGQHPMLPASAST